MPGLVPGDGPRQQEDPPVGEAPNDALRPEHERAGGLGDLFDFLDGFGADDGDEFVEHCGGRRWWVARRGMKLDVVASGWSKELR